jgi:hypothetical protein
MKEINMAVEELAIQKKSKAAAIPTTRRYLNGNGILDPKPR